MSTRSVSHKFGHRTEKAYTKLKYIRRGGKSSRIVKFTVGKSGEYTHELNLIVLRERYVPDVTLESVRQALGHALAEIKNKDFIFRIMPYPHHVLRQNKILGTSKAERISSGMGHNPFGKPIGLKACHLRKNQSIVKLWVYEKDIQLARKALKIASAKIGVKWKITVQESVGSPTIKPKKKEGDEDVEHKVYKGRHPSIY